MLAEAFRISRSDLPGPVLSDLPKDVQNADARHLPSQRPLAVEPPPVPVAQTLATAAERLARSHRPVIYGGGGIALGGAVEAFRTFVDALRIPTVLTLKGLGALPAAHPLHLGLRSEALRVGTECVSQLRTRWSPAP